MGNSAICTCGTSKKIGVGGELDARIVGFIFLTEKNGGIAHFGDRVAVREFSLPNGEPVTANVQGTPRDTYFKQSPRITALNM